MPLHWTSQAHDEIQWSCHLDASKDRLGLQHDTANGWITAVNSIHFLDSYVTVANREPCLVAEISSILAV